MELKIEMSQKQILSQHMVQSMEILQMSAQELEGYIENLSLENPVIELSDSNSYEPDKHQMDLQRKLEWLESTDMQNKVYYQQERDEKDWEDSWHDIRESGETLCDYLMSQLLFENYSENDWEMMKFLLESLDSRGYFTDELSVAANYFGVTQEHIEKLLYDIQSLDPAGVGARDLKECLLLQLRRKMDSNVKNVIKADKVVGGKDVKTYRDDHKEIKKFKIAEILIKNYMDDIAKNHLRDIARKLQVSMDEVSEACVEIRNLNPKPGSSFSSREQLRYISPDVIVVKLKDQFEILVNEYQYPKFSVSSYYRNMLEQTEDAQTKDYLKKKLSQAEWVQNCIAQRSSTLMRVMKVLVEKQHEFFQYGMGHKRPMRLVDIAKELEIHESTVSRTLRGKYLQCSWGVFPLNYFLTSVAVKSQDSDEEKTPEQMKALIQKFIDSENKQKPYSDQAISNKMKEYGIEISRRTVNKYRQEMGLPDKSGRKE